MTTEEIKDKIEDIMGDLDDIGSDVDDIRNQPVSDVIHYLDSTSGGLIDEINKLYQKLEDLEYELEKELEKEVKKDD